MDTRQPRWSTVAAVAVTVALADQLAKAIVPYVHAGIFLPARNTGVLTGASAGPTPLVIAATIAVLVFFVGVVGRWAVQIGVSPFIPAVVAGGILAHAVDRIAFGAVRDFLQTGWLIVDFADLAIVGGLVALAVAAAIRMHELRRLSHTVVLELPTFRAVVIEQRAA